MGHTILALTVHAGPHARCAVPDASRLALNEAEPRTPQSKLKLALSRPDNERQEPIQTEARLYGADCQDRGRTNALLPVGAMRGEALSGLAA